MNKIIKSKKGVELTFNTIIVLVIMIIVLIVLVSFFISNYGSNSETINNVGTSAINSAKNFTK